jgi:hypothetical protein
VAWRLLFLRPHPHSEFSPLMESVYAYRFSQSPMPRNCQRTLFYMFKLAQSIVRIHSNSFKNEVFDCPLIHPSPICCAGCLIRPQNRWPRFSDPVYRVLSCSRSASTLSHRPRNHLSATIKPREVAHRRDFEVLKH